MCPNCKESVEESLAACWNCGTSPDGAPDPNFKKTLLERDHGVEEAAFLARYRCPRCGHEGAEVETVRGASGLVSKLLHLETARFEAVSCLRCRYTELYKADRDMLRDIFSLIG
jgi:predicted nucleic-acid-binding Zn-ribbon protein